ncbi:MAG: sulfur carrier protein ThiS [Bryobacterales bacterium]|nr:sulfur carrier protein ThiS [Bryobacterales bacterium]
MQVVLNGEPRSVPAGMTVATLLSWLNMDGSRVAVELNREIVRQPAWATSEVNDGARVEVVWFVGGGAR